MADSLGSYLVTFYEFEGTDPSTFLCYSSDGDGVCDGLGCPHADKSEPGNFSGHLGNGHWFGPPLGDFDGDPPEFR